VECERMKKVNPGRTAVKNGVRDIFGVSDMDAGSQNVCDQTNQGVPSHLLLKHWRLRPAWQIDCQEDL
jgi:hypothetical protein